MTMQELTKNHTKIAVVGTRNYPDYDHFIGWIKYYTQNVTNVCFVSGGAQSGGDALIKRYAEENEMYIIEHFPQYDVWGKNAPFTRNRKIVEDAEMMIAFWDGKSTGTAHVLGLAKEKGIPIRIVNI